MTDREIPYSLKCFCTIATEDGMKSSVRKRRCSHHHMGNEDLNYARCMVSVLTILTIRMCTHELSPILNIPEMIK